MAPFVENIFVVIEGCGYPKSSEVPGGGIITKTPKTSGRTESERNYTLKDVRLPNIEIECIRCERVDSLERKAAVAKFGASMSFAKLRRRLAMGCDRLCHPDGDLCEMRFRCLQSPNADG
jgi:hypothetical protein